MVRLGIQLAAVGTLTAAFACLVLRPADMLVSAQPPINLPRSVQIPHVPRLLKPTTVAGRPVRIVIPSASIDLPVDPGYYDQSSGEWTLSGYHAQFAMLSTLANTQGGDTFIYGHNNNYVFGALRHHTPAIGAQVLVYTDNGHIFSYVFTTAQNLNPDNTSALSYEGPAQLTVQTCTGSFNEWRTMYRFKLDRLVQ